MRFPYYSNESLCGLLVGRSIVSASTEDATLVLDDGTVLEFDRSNSDCCSWIELTALRGTNNVITRAEFGDDEDDPDNDNYPYYNAWLQVITDEGPLKVAEAHGNASNGYYLHGFALNVNVEVPL